MKITPVILPFLCIRHFLLSDSKEITGWRELVEFDWLLSKLPAMSANTTINPLAAGETFPFAET